MADEGDPRDTIVDPNKTRLGVGPSKARAARDLTGEVVAGCLVESELGAGAMGTVYRGTHVESGRIVAIKALHPHHVDNPKIVERFRREARSVARLHHPNIAGVVDVGGAIDDGRHVIVLEYADGEPLADVMTMPLPAERALPIVRQILLGLEHAHAAGLIHRDLKPDNVIVEWKAGVEVVRIVDFGIATLRDPEEPTLERLTATGQMIGTPMYMAPEQAMCEPFDHRADLFALGVMLYEMLAGKPPFDGSAIDIALANINRDPPPIGKRAGVIVDAVLEAYCVKLMARKREHRFASARDALDVLELYAQDPRTAGPFVGITDVAKAVELITIP